MEKHFNSKLGNKVCFLNNFKNSIFYSVKCDCTSDDCNITLELEYDKDFKNIILHLYDTLNYPYFISESSISFIRKFEEIKERIIDSMKLLFTGKLEVSGELLLRDESHINSFIAALEEGKKYLKDNNENEN